MPKMPESNARNLRAAHKCPMLSKDPNICDPNMPQYTEQLVSALVNALVNIVCIAI